MVVFLVEYGADVNMNTLVDTPLIRAISLGHENIVVYLISKGANTYSKSIPLNESPLMYAISQGNYGLVKKMIACGASIAPGKTCPLLRIASHCPALLPDMFNAGAIQYPATCTEVLSILIKQNIDESIILEQVEELLRREVDPNRSLQDDTPLMVACKKRSVPLMKLLLSYGANANQRVSRNRTVLLHAVYQNNHEMIDLLLKYGANPNFMDDYNMTPLMEALCQDNTDLVEKLIHRCNLTLKTGPLRRTYLMHAVISENISLVYRVLTFNKISIHDTDMDGCTARDLAILHECSFEMIHLIDHAHKATQTTTMDSLCIEIPIPLWRCLLPKEGNVALQVSLNAYRIDSSACYYALFLNEDHLLSKFRKGELVLFSQAPLRSMTRAMGCRPIRYHIVSYLIFNQYTRSVFSTCLRQ